MWNVLASDIKYVNLDDFLDLNFSFLEGERFLRFEEFFDKLKLWFN